MDADRRRPILLTAITLARYGNVTMLDGRRIEDLPLDAVVQELRFGPRDY